MQANKITTWHQISQTGNIIKYMTNKTTSEKIGKKTKPFNAFKESFPEMWQVLPIYIEPS